jgi:hypothetical protein
MTNECDDTILYRNQSGGDQDMADNGDKPRDTLQDLLPLTDSHRQPPVPRSDSPSRRGRASSLQPLPSPV